MSTLVTRKIIKIDEDKCDGCGLCVDACHEGAIQLVNGKAKLVRDDYCDGLGDCLGECPQGAISFEVREAAPYDEDAVQEHLARRDESAPAACPSVRAMLDAIGGKDKLPCGCPSAQARKLERDPVAQTAGSAPSALTNWPTQLALVPPNAPYLREADLLISADCVPFA
ncbi:MAG: 4Fe-4S binding protein, partial [Armatimonadetes bacterium]|nr:4Fe-4S binding protein [Armatimonadota bacterium]